MASLLLVTHSLHRRARRDGARAGQGCPAALGGAGPGRRRPGGGHPRPRPQRIAGRLWPRPAGGARQPADAVRRRGRDSRERWLVGDRAWPAWWPGAAVDQPGGGSSAAGAATSVSSRQAILSNSIELVARIRRRSGRASAHSRRSIGSARIRPRSTASTSTTPTTTISNWRSKPALPGIILILLFLAWWGTVGLADAAIARRRPFRHRRCDRLGRHAAAQRGRLSAAHRGDQRGIRHVPGADRPVAAHARRARPTFGRPGIWSSAERQSPSRFGWRRQAAMAAASARRTATSVGRAMVSMMSLAPSPNWLPISGQRST